MVAKSTATRHSREYYDLREMQDKLAHNKNYAAAGKIKGKADELMAFEEEKWGNERHMEMLHKENVFKAKLSLEAESLRKRVAQGRAEQNRARQVALEKMLLRYHSASQPLLLLSFFRPPLSPLIPPPFHTTLLTTLTTPLPDSKHDMEAAHRLQVSKFEREVGRAGKAR